MIWRQRQHLGQGRFGGRGTCRSVVGEEISDRSQVNISDADQRLDIAGIERERMFIKAARLRHIFGGLSLIRATERGELTGLLRVNTPRVALEMALTSILSKLAWQHPRLSVEVHANDALVDIVAQGFDAGIRIGEAVAQDMIAMRLTTPFKYILVASKAYLDAKGVPKTIADLPKHNCIGLRFIGSGGIYEWELSDKRKGVAVKTSGTALVTDPTHARDLARAGVGIAYTLEPLVRSDIREGRLKWILPSTAVNEDGLFLYYPRRASLAPKLRAFIDAAKGLGLGSR